MTKPYPYCYVGEGSDQNCLKNVMNYFEIWHQNYSIMITGLSSRFFIILNVITCVVTGISHDRDIDDFLFRNK